MDYNLYWSAEAVDNLEEILDYLTAKWTEKEVIKFKYKLNKQLDLIKQNPLIFPKSSFNPSLRKAVLSSQTTIFYKISDNRIDLAYLFVNKKDISKIK
jgi:plasmid stabilization system protein ParE